VARSAEQQTGGSLKRRNPGLQARVSGNEISLEKDHMTNNTTVVDMRKFVEARDGKAFTTSQQVAQAFGKQHHHVMQKLGALDCSDQFLTSNFSRVKFEHRGNAYEAYEMTKDGFMFLVMGFTGKSAAAIKEGYIAAFNEMAARLNLAPEVLVSDLVGSVIGSTGEVVLSRVIEQKGYRILPAMQRSFTTTMKSRLRSRFNVQKTSLIPADQMEAACNFIAAYVIEGDYIAREDSKAATLPGIHLPVEVLASRREGMITIRNGEQAWLDVTLHDLRDIHGTETPCEKLLGDLDNAGFNIEAAWWELRTYRNKLQELNSFVTGMGRVIEDPHRYAIKPRSAA
jgi:Rha family phage regulatory protein